MKTRAMAADTYTHTPHRHHQPEKENVRKIFKINLKLKLFGDWCWECVKCIKWIHKGAHIKSNKIFACSRVVNTLNLPYLVSWHSKVHPLDRYGEAQFRNEFSLSKHIRISHHKRTYSISNSRKWMKIESGSSSSSYTFGPYTYHWWLKAQRNQPEDEAQAKWNSTKRHVQTNAMRINFIWVMYYMELGQIDIQSHFDSVSAKV